jgi:hypothetical protein
MGYSLAHMTMDEETRKGTNYLYSQLIVYILVVCLWRVIELAHLEYLKT